MSLQRITTDIIEDNAVTGSKMSVAPVGQSPAAGDIFYFNGSSYVKLPIGAVDDTLIVVNGMPQWSDVGGSGTSFSGNVWLFGGTQGSVATTNLLYYSLNSDGHAVVATATRWAAINNITTLNGSITAASATEAFFICGNVSTVGGNIGGTDSCEKFTFASATDSANPTTLTAHGLSAGVAWGSGTTAASSETHGYVPNGRTGSGIAIQSRDIRKIQFASVNASVLTTANTASTCFGIKSQGNSTVAIFAGGRFTDGNNDGQNRVTNVDQFTFSNDTCQTGWSQLNVGVEDGTSSGDETNAFFYGGLTQSAQGGGTFYHNVIEKFAYASSSSRTDFGSLLFNSTLATGAQTATHGFNVGGVNCTVNSALYISDVVRYAFASNATGTIVADLQLVVGGGSSVQIPTISF